MILAPRWRTRLFALGASTIAVCLGFAVAQGNWVWPSLVSAALLLFLLAQWQPRPIVTVLLATILFGYVVGNRGFAQLTLMPGFPLLPAEAVLIVAGALLLVQSAWRHELPVRRDALNVVLLAWIVAGTIQVFFNVRLFGFMALRDFALVYYALFFYLAQEVAHLPASARALQNTLLVSVLVLFGTYLVYDHYLSFFFTTLTFRGAPLIAYKGDLVGTFLAVGSVLMFLRFEERRRWWLVAASLIFATAVIATGNRASLVGLLVAAAWLAVGRRWRFAAVLGGSGAVAALVILTIALFTNVSWEKTPLFGVYERAVSLVDPSGRRTYRGEDTFNKGDNNLFRTVWWQAVIDETFEENPYTGLGFGRDIADRFVRAYYPEAGDEFNTRSPHNVLLTIFARMGAVGLLLFLATMGIVAVRTWRAVRAGPREAAPWCAVWVIFTSSCFGVVLEGPMGAVVFWTLLGVAHASSTPTNAELVADATGDHALETESRPAIADAEPSR